MPRKSFSPKAFCCGASGRTWLTWWMMSKHLGCFRQAVPLSGAPDRLKPTNQSDSTDLERRFLIGCCSCRHPDDDADDDDPADGRWIIFCQLLSDEEVSSSEEWRALRKRG